MKTLSIKMSLVLLLGCLPLWNCGSAEDETDDTIISTSEAKGDDGNLRDKCEIAIWSGEVNDGTPVARYCNNECTGNLVCTLLSTEYVSKDRMFVEACCQPVTSNAAKLGSMQGSSKTKTSTCLSKYGCK
jgi:hypothetical protein